LPHKQEAKGKQKNSKELSHKRLVLFRERCDLACAKVTNTFKKTRVLQKIIIQRTDCCPRRWLFGRKKVTLPLSSKLSRAMPASNIDYRVENIRFEIADGGHATIWFDLKGARFDEPEAMANMLVDFDDFLKDFSRHFPAIYAKAHGDSLQKSDTRHDQILERLDAQVINWPKVLHGFVERQFDLEQTENERVGWLHDRRRRAADADWEKLTKKAASTDPSWDEVANRLIDEMNAAVMDMYPELLDTDAETNSRLREILESHMGRLANEVVGLVQEGRKG